jgi:hypothetical protein
LNPHVALLRSRARGDQVYRRDTPRPLPTDPNVIISKKIDELLIESRKKESEKHIADAVRLTRKALKLARALPTCSETSLVDQIERRDLYLKRFLKHSDRILLRSDASSDSEAYST